MNRKRFQGDQGQATAILHYTRQGYIVSVPMTEGCRYDLIIDDGQRLHRVQVKSTSYQLRGSYVVQLRTSGGEMYGRGSKIHWISEAECDLVFVLSADGMAWEFPAALADGRSTITLNGDKLEYQVGEYAPITDRLYPTGEGACLISRYRVVQLHGGGPCRDSSVAERLIHAQEAGGSFPPLGTKGQYPLGLISR